MKQKVHCILTNRIVYETDILGNKIVLTLNSDFYAKLLFTQHFVLFVFLTTVDIPSGVLSEALFIKLLGVLCIIT